MQWKKILVIEFLFVFRLLFCVVEVVGEIVEICGIVLVVGIVKIEIFCVVLEDCCIVVCVVGEDCVGCIVGRQVVDFEDDGVVVIFKKKNL